MRTAAAAATEIKLKMSKSDKSQQKKTEKEIGNVNWGGIK